MDRLTREYVYLHKKLHKDDVMHLHRETVLQSALATVLDQIKPATQLPLGGDEPTIMQTVQPMLEIALQLSGPTAAERAHTKAWIQEKIQTGDYSFKECSEFPELMDAYVHKKMAEAIAAGSTTGRLVLQPGEEPVGPEATYTLCTKRVGRRRATVSVCPCSRACSFLTPKTPV